MQLSNPQRLIYEMEKYAGGAVAVVCGSALFTGSVAPEKLTAAIHKLFRLNEALCIHIQNVDGQPCQKAVPYTEKGIHILRFDSVEAFHRHAGEYAKESVPLYGPLYEVHAVFIPNRYGILVKCHHVVGDAWTLTLMVSQLAAILAGETPPAFPYSVYIESEAVYARSARQEKDKAFFLEQFKTCPEPVYFSEKPGDSFEACRSTFQIHTDLAAHLRFYAEKHRTSPFALFFAAFAVYFSRVKMNPEKFYIGTSVLNRSTFREKNTMGMFINTIPILATIDYTHTFAENLAAMQTAILSSFRHQKFHYNNLLAAIRREYHFTERLYDVTLSYQNAAVTGAGQEVETTWYHSGTQTESLQIHIDDRDSKGAFRIHLDYRTDKFTAVEIQRVYGQILNLLQDAISHDEKTPEKLALLSPEEEQLLLHDFNDTAVDYPREKCIHTLFEEQVERTPDKTAVIACDRTLTYRELNEEANRIAHGLIKQKVGVGDIIAFALPRDGRLIPAILGILKAGAAYLPIDPDYPQERIDYMLEDSGAKVFVTKEELSALLTAGGNNENPNLSVSSESLCYCIYTSGSTGKPKGGLISHRNLMNFCADNHKNNLQHCIAEVCHTVLACGAIVFDISNFEIILSLLLNKTVALASENVLLSGSALAEWISLYHVDCIHCTPTKFRTYMESGDFAAALLNVKCIMVGGEELTVETRRLIERYSASAIFNGYGPTETTMGVCFGESGTSIGRPIANTQIFIVDKYLNPVPVGVTGELCIAGDGVGVGYLNRPELTAEKFIPNPFGEGKLYKTGDLACWREDGNIVYVGRNDFQVKIRGLRIELGEIESAIASIEGIRQAVVAVRKDDTGRQLICAFYTGTAPVEPEAIRSALRKKLPQYMMPHIFTKLDALPMGASGKVNRKALPEVSLSASGSEVKYVAPATKPERVLASAVAKVLGVKKAGMKDSFFDLGGDSLKAIELTAVLEQAGYHTEVKAIFEAENLGELATELATAHIETEAEVPAGEIPVSPAQMRVYTAQNISGGTTYNVPYSFKVKKLDPKRLQAAIDLLIVRHEILRTRFENRDGVIIQVVDDGTRCQVEKLSSDNFSAFIRPFDLEAAPLLRVGYCGNTVLLDMHHIITDGGSMPIFLRELNELYMGRELTDTPVQYRTFAAQTKTRPEDEIYWRSVFQEEPPVLELNTDYPRQNKQRFEGTAIYKTIPATVHKRICTQCRKLDVTPYVYYLGAFYILLSKFSGNEDIVIGTPASGRRGKFLCTLGMFVNTLALRSRPKGTKTVQEYLSEVKAVAIDALAHQEYPYGDIVKHLGIHPEGRNPLFDIMFAYQSEEMAQVIFGDVPAELLPVPVTASKYDFTFNVMPCGENVVLMVEYCTALFKETTIRRLIEGYKLLLEQMLDEVALLKDLTAVTERERHMLLFDFNDTAVEYPRDKCVHTLFEEQVERTPDKTALVFSNIVLSYKQLNGLANGVAWQLKLQGVKKGDIVAILAKRSYEVVIAILAILKAGAAYLPIDCDYPANRITTILKDSNCQMLLTYGVDYTWGKIIDLNRNITFCSKNPLNVNSPLDVCAAIYTSGSTGKPKGALIHHQGLVNYTYANDALYTHGHCVVGFSIYTFDAFFLDTICPMLRGIPSILSTEAQQFQQFEFEQLIKENPHCNLFITPAKLKLFLSNSIDKHFYKDVNNICIGGELFPQEFVDIFAEKTNVFNVYGPTECSMWVLEFPIKNGDIALGHPIANTQIYIVDKYMVPVPLGVTGELCIAGDSVGAGYLNRPELTAEKFIDNPFGEGKLYKTGDLAYWREDGNIVYVGRNDFQVKIRGLRVELGEIENAIASVEGAGQAVVVVRRDDTGRQLICAFYTETAPVDLKAVKSTLREKLPRYMMPHVFTKLDSLPMTTSGKVNRKALPEVDLSNPERNEEYIPPEGGAEKQLAIIMERVLNYSPIGRDDNFFDLGGDSLKAIEFLSKAHRDGLYFSLQNVFDYPTIRQLHQCMEDGDKLQISYAGVDFSQIHRLLSKNCLNKAIPPVQDMGNILLAGATGFLGIHILADYLEHDKGTAYCLVRGKTQAESKKRLIKLLDIYFGDKYANLIDSRIHVLCSDLQKDYMGLDSQEYRTLLSNVDTVINSAASVKHYGSYQYFREVNVEAVGRLIAFCQSGHAKLIHISTLSVSGNSFGDDFSGYVSETEKHFYESDLYIGQPLENVYARSKFEAEKLVLEAALDGLPVHIMRMGNLTNRQRDGMFQVNFQTNAAVQRIKGVIELGIVPDYLITEDMYVEFTPIDEAAQAVMLLIRHFDPERTVFHINSTKVVYMDKLMEYFTALGYPLRAVPGDEFTATLRETAKQAGMEHIFETFINDMDENDRLNYDSNIRIKNTYTEEYLKQLGFIWGEIGQKYLRKYTKHFRKIGYWRGAL